MSEEITRVQTWLLEHGLSILVILSLSIGAYFLLGFVINKVKQRVMALDGEEGSALDKRVDTIATILHSTGLVAIGILALVTVLQELGIPIAPLLASVGVVGLALGLGAQTLVKDVISGIFILVENQYTIGDVVELSGITGTVEEMTLRATLVRDLHGTLHTIPNGEIRVVANRTRDWSRAIVDVAITYEADVDRALALLQTIGEETAVDAATAPLLLEPPQVTGIEGLEDWSVRIRLMVKTLPNQHWGVQRTLRRRIRLEFAQEGIDLAFPRQEVAIVTTG